MRSAARHKDPQHVQPDLVGCLAHDGLLGWALAAGFRCVGFCVAMFNTGNRANAAVHLRRAERPARSEGRRQAHRCPWASLESVHDLQFKTPAFMGQQYRGKVLDPYGEPVHDQYYATVAVRRDSAAQLVVEHLVRAG